MTTTADQDLTVAELMLKAHLAKRDMPVVGDEEHPTPWDLNHRRIDELLTRWEQDHALGSQPTT